MQNSAEISHILGIDFGQAKVGLAKADSETKIAFAYGTLDNDRALIDKLGDIIVKEAIETIVIGKPKESEKFNSLNISKFASEVEEFFPLVRVEYEDEAFTTKMAEDRIKETGKRNIKELDNQEAAKIILQSWLDRQ